MLLRSIDESIPNNKGNNTAADSIDLKSPSDDAIDHINEVKVVLKKPKIESNDSKITEKEYSEFIKADTEEDKEEIPKEKKEHMINQLLKSYNLKFIQKWQFTINYRLWQLLHSSKLFCFSDIIGNFIYYIDHSTMATIYYENSDVYIGGIINGKKTGNGTFVYDNGESIYEGEWLNDKRNGKGIQITKNGTYSGNFFEYKIQLS